MGLAGSGGSVDNSGMARHNLPKIWWVFLADTARDRLARLEANTILGNFLLLAAFHFSPADFIIRMTVTIFLNALGYFINDYIDVEVDLANTDKDHKKALFIKQHKRQAVMFILFLSILLIGFSWFYSKSVCFAVVMLIICVSVYTAFCKNIVFLDVLFIGLWGFFLSWIAIPDFSFTGIKLIGLLFLFGCCFEIVQTIKDYDHDKKYGLRTSPVVLGINPTFVILRSLYVVSVLYTLVILREAVGIVLLIPLLFNKKQNMSTYWSKLKIICGIVWIVLMVRLYFGYLDL